MGSCAEPGRIAFRRRTFRVPVPLQYLSAPHHPMSF